jgi:hypothetical protein
MKKELKKKVVKHLKEDNKDCLKENKEHRELIKKLKSKKAKK